MEQPRPAHITGNRRRRRRSDAAPKTDSAPTTDAGTPPPAASAGTRIAPLPSTVDPAPTARNPDGVTAPQTSVASMNLEPPTGPGRSSSTTSAKAGPSMKAAQPAKRRQRREPDRGSHDIVGAGRSQLGVQAAMRARDVNRPTDDDLAEAERTVVIVRRHWQPERGH